MDVTAACAMLIRAIVSTYPHSGLGTPPMWGDFEAQRHWMELTIHLPLNSWYRDTKDNNLLYWGLDYPPLTAFGSWLAGEAGRLFAPQAVAWEVSRGAEDPGTIAFMRGTVLVADALIYVPAVWFFATTTAPHASRMRIFSALALLPPLVLVDHGHFQYNGVSLGLAMLAVIAIARGQRLAAAFAFSCALNYKQMLLYYAPAWFVFLLAECFGSSSGSTSRISAVRHITALGGVVLAVFAMTWLPFCAFADASETGGNLAACVDGIGSVVKRLFPFDRSLFEDKVANVWCALEPLLKLRARIYADTTGRTRSAAVRAAAILTAAFILPALFGLWREMRRGPGDLAPAVQRATGQGGRPLQATHSSRAATASSGPDGSDASDTRTAGYSSSDGIRSRIVSANRSPASGSAMDAYDERRTLEAGRTSCPEIKLSTDDAFTAALLWRPWELLLLAQHAVALGFFLVSYQVCEYHLLCSSMVTLSLQVPACRSTKKQFFSPFYRLSCSAAASRCSQFG